MPPYLFCTFRSHKKAAPKKPVADLAAYSDTGVNALVTGKTLYENCNVC